MPLWEKWTGVKEVSHRVSISVGGKSSLDRLFGTPSFVLKHDANKGGGFLMPKLLLTL